MRSSLHLRILTLAVGVSKAKCSYALTAPRRRLGSPRGMSAGAEGLERSNPRDEGHVSDGADAAPIGAERSVERRLCGDGERGGYTPTQITAEAHSRIEWTMVCSSRIRYASIVCFHSRM